MEFSFSFAFLPHYAALWSGMALHHELLLDAGPLSKAPLAPRFRGMDG